MNSESFGVNNRSESKRSRSTNDSVASRLSMAFRWFYHGFAMFYLTNLYKLIEIYILLFGNI